MRGGTRGWVALWLVGAAGCAAVRAPAPPPITNGVQVGVASWYGPGFHGNRTANGEIYDQYELTAAHPSLALGTRVMVTNLENGRAVQVRVNDRGPFVDGRAIDLSYAAARTIGMVGPGTVRVRIEVLGPTTLAAAVRWPRRQPRRPRARARRRPATSSPARTRSRSQRSATPTRPSTSAACWRTASPTPSSPRSRARAVTTIACASVPTRCAPPRSSTPNGSCGSATPRSSWTSARRETCGDPARRAGAPRRLRLAAPRPPRPGERGRPRDPAASPRRAPRARVHDSRARARALARGNRERRQGRDRAELCPRRHRARLGRLHP